MKSSRSIRLIAVPLLVSCSPDAQIAARPRDPCVPSSYDATSCQNAIAQRGYYYDGIFYPHFYSNPYVFYQNGYTGYIASGGRSAAIEPGHFSPSFNSGTVRGGFGGSAAAHAGGAGE
ncbi:MAG TPA: hypothetical protein VGQ30_00795 [Gemmatimonadaceae bacterium]|jgi:hypothetical protein|nr:hypothetical protein [Gemmatimonadaceae bacterium]